MTFITTFPQIQPLFMDIPVLELTYWGDGVWGVVYQNDEVVAKIETIPGCEVVTPAQAMPETDPVQCIVYIRIAEGDPE